MIVLGSLLSLLFRRKGVMAMAGRSALLAPLVLALCAVPSRSVDVEVEADGDPFLMAGRCEEYGQRCIFTRKDNPLPHVGEPVARPGLAFVSIGDWGCGEGNCDRKPDPMHHQAGDTQKRVAENMAKVAANVDSSLVLALGDNFYFQGVDSPYDPLWKTVWQDRFNQASLQTPWFACLGNHDHYGNAQAQIDFSHLAIDRRWILPNYYWTTSRPIGDTGRKIQFVFIDTVILDTGYTREILMEKIQAGVVEPGALETFNARGASWIQAQTEQLQWLEETLAASTADWLIVIGHYPVLSGGEHGSTQSLIASVKPLLEKYNVDAYMGGHDHTLQHLEDKGVAYYVNGNGCLRGVVKPLPEDTLFAAVDPGFMVHQVDGDTMVNTMIDDGGRAVYQHTLHRKRNLGPELAGAADCHVHVIGKGLHDLEDGSRIIVQ